MSGSTHPRMGTDWPQSSRTWVSYTSLELRRTLIVQSSRSTMKRTAGHTVVCGRLRRTESDMDAGRKRTSGALVTMALVALIAAAVTVMAALGSESLPTATVVVGALLGLLVAGGALGALVKALKPESR